jgi:hypothetical protein
LKRILIDFLADREPRKSLKTFRRRMHMISTLLISLKILSPVGCHDLKRKPQREVHQRLSRVPEAEDA